MSTSPIESVPAVTLGWRLRMAMEHAKINRDEMAAHFGVHPSAITRWTHDNGSPRKSELRDWAELCGVSLVWLETGQKPGPKQPTGEGLSRLTEAKRTRSRSRVRATDVTQPYDLCTARAA